MPGYPSLIVPAGQLAPCPRRIRGVFAGRTIFDTGNARYVWERPHYPQYYLPLADVAVDLLRDEHADQRLVDVQWSTAHLASLGVVTVPRAEYRRRLATALELPLPKPWA